ncbi:hypothetical protein FOXG_17300 [Fusarium oxysporum f. sp. lycopersici 4287]|uniref:Uncharacterized protein n=2 Tax=Fusarium oxysporum TaxID=5507 RepID=A0A0J9W9P0_FUSO4|nr:uncharacterized protein FOXG_17300 [Fusarium oxysporum f. sp. lycopersici 4287]KNB20064.1 hypothetical protein FOXG_17300 [Fusarium oxysporum f. sp. lycopersici 4287]
MHSACHDSKEFFFLDPNGRKKHLSSNQASDILRSRTQDLITPWTLSLYRQAALVIAKRYLAKLVEKSNFYYPSSAGDLIYIASKRFPLQKARKMYNHMPVYGRKASEHINAMPLWRAYKLQIYFTAKGLIDYFLVEEDLSLPTTGGALAGSGLAMASMSQEEGKLFKDLKADII